MSYRCQDTVWDYVRPSASFQNVGTYAPPLTPRVHAFAAVPRTEPADCKMQPPVGGIGTDVCKGRQNPYRGGLGSFHLRFTYLREGGHQVSRSPGPGSYEIRHLTGGALVKRPKTASPCFGRSGGRLRFDGGGTWHKETPLESAERRGTVRGIIQAQPQRYSQSFRSRSDRLVVNKPASTTHEGLGPGCYDVSKDGKSVGVKTEKRVRGGGCAGKGSTNQFLTDWRAYMRRPPKVNDGYGDCSCVSGDGTSAGHRGKPERSSPSVLYTAPETPRTASYTLRSQSESWPAARKRIPVAASRGRKAGGPKLRLRESEQTPPRQAPSQQHRRPEEKAEESFFPRQQPPQSRSPLSGRAKRPASACASFRVPSMPAPQTLPNRCSGLLHRSNVGGGRSGCGSVLRGESSDYCDISSSSTGVSGPPQFVPRPSSAVSVSRPRSACPATAVSQDVEDEADSCCCGDRSQSRGDGGEVTKACAHRRKVPPGMPALKLQPSSGSTSAAAEEAAHQVVSRLPPKARPIGPEKAAAVDLSERPPGGTEDDAPRPPVNSTMQSEGPREEDSSGEDSSTTGSVAFKPATGSQGDEPTERVTAAIPCSLPSHGFGEAGHTADVVGEGKDLGTAPSSGLPPGASSGRTPSSPLPSSQRRSNAPTARNRPLESTGSRSPGKTIRRTDTAELSPTLSLASRTTRQQVAPRPPLSPSNIEKTAPTPTTCEAASRAAAAGRGEEMASAIWRIQSSTSFSSILDLLDRRATDSSLPLTEDSGSMVHHLDHSPSRPLPGAGGPWDSNHERRKSSESTAGCAEQPPMSPRGRYESFQLRHGSTLAVVAEGPQVGLAAAGTTQEIISSAVSAVIATRLSGGASIESSGGSALECRNKNESTAGSAEQPPISPPGRYKPFQLRQGSTLGVAAERSQVGLAAGVTTEVIVSGAVSAVIAARLSGNAGIESSGGSALDSQMP